MNLSKKSLDDLTYEINGAAIEVHKDLGPGLLESIYQKCLAYELWLRGIDFDLETVVPITYKAMELSTHLRCDLLVEKSIVVELKTVKEILPVHQAQVLSYMKLLEAPKGLLYNFNTANLYHEGQRSYVNEYFEMLPKE